MTLRDKTNAAVKTLSSIYDDREARNIIDLAVSHIKGWSRIDMLLNSDKEISNLLSEKIDAVTRRLLTHEPIQYILGETYWHGLTLKVAPGVLIPRPETSELVNIITDENNAEDLDVLDLCTGSGAIALALSRFLRFPKVTAVDISSEALDIARENDKILRTGINFILADILRPLPFPDGSFDIMVSNPPYICESEKQTMSPNVLDYEPSTALFVPDSDPLKYYRPIAVEGYRTAKPGARIYLEINPDHALVTRQLLREKGWNDAEIVNDMHGRQRFVKATRH